MRKIDFDFIVKSIPIYFKAFQLTIIIGFLGIIFSIIIGFLCSLVRFYKIKFLNGIVAAYIEISRNTPLLIQLFFLYYGLPKVGITIDATVCAVVGLSFLGGSYMAEAFRSGFEAVEKIQKESGLSLGLTNGQLIRYIILPQALSIAMPSLGANAIFILKETSVFSAIALADLMYVAKDLIGMYYNTTEALFMLVIAYLIVLLPMSLILNWLERRMRHGQFGN